MHSGISHCLCLRVCVYLLMCNNEHSFEWFPCVYQKLKAIEGQMTEKCDLITSLKEELEKVQEAERLEKSVSVLMTDTGSSGVI